LQPGPETPAHGRYLMQQQKEWESLFRNAVDPEAKGPGKVYYGSGHFAQVKDFVDSICNKTPPMVQFHQAAESVLLIQEFYRAAKEEITVSLPETTWI